MKSILLFLGLSLSFFMLNAQPPGGRPGGGPETMLAREKQALYDKAEDLSEDQKQLIDGIYDEFLVTLKETFQDRSNTDREARREKMQTLRKEKDALMEDVLNEEQYEIYQSVSARRGKRRNQQQREE